MGTSIEKRILDAVLLSGLADKQLFQNALRKMKDSGKKKSPIRQLVEDGVISEKDLLAVVAKELNIPLADLSAGKIDEAAARSIPEKIARKYNMIPIAKKDNKLTLVISDPTDIFAVDDARSVTGCEITLALAPEDAIRSALVSVWSSGGENIAQLLQSARVGGEDVEFVGGTEDMETLDVMSEIQTAPIVKVVAVMISEAIRRRASDIHVEPEEKYLRIRYRIDGRLYDYFELPKRNQNAVIARLKIMSNLDITETRLPQDGRFKIKLENKEIDFRVSSLPAIFGNKMVLRLLDKENLAVGLESLGFLPERLNDFNKALEKPFGVILVTGPTGSGKSTTLYSVLNRLNVPEKNIVTIEDPVEYQIPGITQIAVQHEIGLTFASGLRSVLRQTPDVIMVGEIRDSETADTAIKSSLTGHMVLSTLHTNDAVGAITRLVNMGVEPFLISSSIIMVCAQRLMRKICPYCKSEADISKEVFKDMEKKYSIMRDTKKFYAGMGCAKCNNTGFLGRFGILETILIDDTLKDMITELASESKMLEYARTKGFKDLRESAVTRFCDGWTTLEEVFSVT